MTVPLRASPVERVADALEKPDLDTRTYRVIRLGNDLEVLLIHDPDTDKAAAAMDVNVGSFSDSEDMPGIAHAVEHLLFMGTEKYPGENEYNSYLTRFAGHSNAFTASTSTNYYFELSATSTAKSTGTSTTNLSTTPISKDKAPLYGALDRFSQFFIKPLFLEDTLDRELRAVDSENKKNLQSDMWRLHQLNKSTSSKKHPFHKFSTGNYKVLHDDPIARGVKIRDEFINFYQTHYSANRMKLTVLGVEQLDELEDWVTELFADVPNQNLPQLRWDGIPAYEASELGTQTFAKPVMDQRMISLEFPYPDEEDLYASQPARYPSHLIGHEGPGSILAYLKERGWASGLSSGVRPACPGTSFFSIDVRLTEDGLKQYPEVLKAIFQYIALLREQPPYEWIVDEMKRLGEVEFKFRQKAPASSTVSRLSGLMQKPLRREWLLSGPTVIREFDAVNIRRGIDALRPDNFRFTIVSQSFPGNWDQKEKWYGTEYRYEKIPADLMSELESAAAAPESARPAELYLPGVNEFVPQRLDVEKKEIKEPAITPTLIRNDDGVRTWFKKDDQFWVPKANIFVCLRTPLAASTPLLAILSSLYTSLVSDSLEEYAYDAELAGLNYSLDDHSQGMDISIHGYNDKMSVLLEKVLLSMRDLEIKQERFDIIKERKQRALKNAEFLDPFRQITGYTRWLMRTGEAGSWINEELAAELESVTVSDVRNFFPQLLRQMHIEILAHGNLSRDDALGVSRLVEKTLAPHRLPPSQWPTRRTLLLPAGADFVYQRPLKNPDNVNHCLEYTLLTGSAADYALRARVLLFDKLAEEPCFDTLRTKEQLGYVVGSGSVVFSTQIGWRIVVQSERTCEFLERRCDAFLEGFGKVLEEMEEDVFEANKVGLVNKRLERLKNLSQESNRFWAHVTAETLDFELVYKDVAAIEPLTKADLLDFFKTYISPSSSSRSKVSVHLIAQAETATANGDENGEAASMDAEATTNGATNGTTNGTADSETATTAGTIEKSIGGSDGKEGLVASKKQAVVIRDVKAWKDSLMMSAGPRPVKALREFEEVGAKL